MASVGVASAGISVGSAGAGVAVSPPPQAVRIREAVTRIATKVLSLFIIFFSF
jgi:hypothetical protein